MKLLSISLLCALALAACNGDPRPNGEPADTPAPVTNGGTNGGTGINGAARGPERYIGRVVGSWTHDTAAFTQGLMVHEGKLYETTGQYGTSSLRLVELESGKVLKKVDFPQSYFVEGMTILNGRIYILTWENQVGFIYDLASFERLGTFSYQGEGWGLTSDGTHLIMSNGTHRLNFIDPTTLAVTRTVDVLDGGVPVMYLNELEMIGGEIYANVWQTDRIARIDPATGAVRGWIDLSNLRGQLGATGQIDVLNGIAYDSAKSRILVTGKLWPKLFAIELEKQPLATLFDRRNTVALRKRDA